MEKHDEKTNAMRLLEQKKIACGYHFYDGSSVPGAVEVAAMLGQNPARVYKTLVTVGKSGGHYVFMAPGAKELDLKKAAKAAGEKSLEMIPQKELLPLTGYVHGGCSPVGMKKPFRTWIDQSAEQFETVYFSGGRPGCQICADWRALKKLIRIEQIGRASCRERV